MQVILGAFDLIDTLGSDQIDPKGLKVDMCDQGFELEQKEKQNMFQYTDDDGRTTTDTTSSQRGQTQTFLNQP